MKLFSCPRNSRWILIDLIFTRHQSDQSGKAKYVLFNPGVSPANVTATLLFSDGTPVDMPLNAIVAPKGQSVFAFDTVASSSGYVRVQSDRPLSGVEICESTNDLSVLGAVSPSSEARLFLPHIALNNGFTTWLGLVNPNSTGTIILLKAFDDSRQPLGTPASIWLEPNAQLLQAASDIFGIGPGSLVTGYAIAEADQAGLHGFTAYRDNNAKSGRTVAVLADSVPRQHLLFSHVAQMIPANSGGTPQTGIVLLNPFGIQGKYTIRVFAALHLKVSIDIAFGHALPVRWGMSRSPGTASRRTEDATI